MIKTSLSFVRKNKNKDITAFATLEVQSPINNKKDILQLIKAAITQWCDVTDEGNIVAGYASNEPNIADISESLIDNKELKAILKGYGITATDISINPKEPYTDHNTFDYDISLYDANLSQITCAKCHQDLREVDSVTREYVNKDGGDSEYCKGFYTKNDNDFTFEPSSDVSLAGGRYDLLDDSDKCTNCNHQL